MDFNQQRDFKINNYKQTKPAKIYSNFGQCREPARQLDAGLELRRCGCERCGQQQQRAVVGIDVGHGCREQLGQLGLQRQGAGGARGGVVDGHEGRDGVRGVDVEVEQRG